MRIIMSNLIICKNQRSDYKIVFSPSREDSAAAAALLQSVIYASTGATLPLVADTASSPEGKEIVVGKTNRENVTFPYERYSIRENGFICGAYGETLALVGGSFHCERFAVIKFLSDFCGYDPVNPYNKPKKLDEICVPSDYYYENSPRSWVDFVPAPKASDGAMIYMIPTYTLPGGNNALRGMGYVIRSRSGKLLVVDGGHSSDAELIISLLKKLSGEEIPTVDGWFFTHMHADHVDAFLNIALNMPGALKVKAVYHSFPSREFAIHWKEEMRLTKFERIIENNFCPFVRVTRGDTVDFDDVNMLVVFNVDAHFEKYLTDRTEASKSSINLPQGDCINNSDTLYKFTADGHSLLILGDFMHFGEEYVYTYYPETLRSFKADMVQCAHHGSNFMGQKIYSYIGARKAFWSTTLDSWFWRDGFIAWLRTRLFELGVVKNHIAGQGIIPIPFDMSDITEEETAHLRSTLSRVSFTVGEMTKLLIVNKSEYDVYTDNGRVEFTLDTFKDNENITVTDANGIEVSAENGAYSLALSDGESFAVTVNGERKYTFTAVSRPKRRELLWLDMNTVLENGNIADLSGNGANAVSNGAELVNENGRNAIRVGAKNHLSIKDARSLLMSDGDFTISVWIKPDEAVATQTVYYFGDDQSGSVRYMLRIGNQKFVSGEYPNRLIFHLTSGKSGASASVVSRDTITSGEWHNITVTSTGLTQRMYVDGEFSSERSFMRPIDLDAQSNELLVGVQPHGEHPFSGAMGEMKILNYALTDTEIAELYAKER